MELTHAFTVPSAIDSTWAHFQDIGAVAECFPGAQVTSVDASEDGASTFEGTCKVKLGPIALVYAGAGTFVERDEEAHRFVVEAKGRDKRGNGTAGATVTLTMAAAGDGTSVEVLTELSVTGKPAQFGRGVMQDVSDKLLGQFVGCLEQRLAGDGSGAAADDAVDAVPADTPTDTPSGAPSEAAVLATAPVTAPDRAPDADDSLDLGAGLVPILLKNYGKQAAVAVLGLLVLVLVGRRLRR